MTTAKPATPGQLLRRFRLAAGFSQEHLSEQSGVSVRAISDLERGQRASAHLETARLLAMALGLSDDDRRALLEAARPELREDVVVASHQRPPGLESSRWMQSLPVPPTSLIGRESVLAEIASLLKNEPGRVITLTGTGGVGKTRVAIEVARKIAPVFADGVVFVSLAPLSDPSLVTGAIAQALGIELTSTSLLERISTVLQNRRLLLVLDNFEHLVDAAPLISKLMTAAPDPSVLVTSRVRLRLSTELEYPVPPLNLPDAQASLQQLQSSGAIQLFTQRARAIDPHFSVTEQNARAVSDICRRLDGLPLAIELATSRLKVLPVASLLTRIERRLPLLTGGSRDSPQRQQSMRDTIAWSYDLLSPVEQQLFRWLSVFAGGVSLEEAEATEAAIGIDAAESLVVVSALVEYGLLQRAGNSDAEFRFHMLETIREYGGEQLAATGEVEAARAFHALHFLAFARQDAPALHDPAASTWIRRLIPVQDDLLLAFDHLCRQETSDLCLQFAAVIGAFWYEQGPIRESWSRLQQATRLAPPAPSLLKFTVWIRAAALAMNAGDFASGSDLAQEAITMAHALGDRSAEAMAIHCLAWNEEQQEHWEEASALLERELVLWIELGHAYRQGVALMLLGGVDYARGNRALARSREEQAAAIFYDAESADFLASTQWYLGFIEVADHRLDRAASYYRLSLRTWLQSETTSNWFKPLIGLADIAAVNQQFEVAARLLGAADNRMHNTGAHLFPFDEPGYNRASQASKRALGEAAFTLAYEEGRISTPDDWLTEATFIVKATAM
ncbi:BTAD domain-containing putative transcriptional regulator [soil metagenome]